MGDACPQPELPPYIRVSDWTKQRPRAEFTIPDPCLVGPVQEPYDSIWAATCRIRADAAVGSGFFVNTAPVYVVTCAHVVDRAETIVVERPVMGGAFFEHWPATLVSIDYSHDLAVLSIDDPQHKDLGAGVGDFWNNFPLMSLELASAPSPGESAIICGFPEGVDNPRLATGLVSGYDSVRLGRTSIHAVALDASINPGNSGGPVCSPDGKVIGVVFARPTALKLAGPILTGISQGLLAVLEALNANNGIGYALDPRDVKQLLNSYSGFCNLTRRTYRRCAPTKVPIPKETFVDLQVECRNLGRSPVGVFSFGREMQLCHGWSNDADRAQLSTPGWDRCLREISWSGGSFLLRGYEVLLYRQRYKGYVVPVVLSLT